MRTQILLKIIFLMTLSLNAEAAYKFSDFMRSLTVEKENVVTEVPDINRFYSAKSLQEAVQISLNQTYPQMLAQEVKPSVLNENLIQGLIQKKLITVVIVPGLLGEFID